MNPTLALALDKFKNGKARDQLSPGIHNINALVRLTGEIEILDDEEYTPTVSLPILEIMALFIAHAGFTREHTMALIRQCCGEAINQDGKAKDSLKDNVEVVTKTLETVKKEITSKFTKQTRKGKVKCKVEAVEVLALPEAA
jgi:hypothetical protein